MKIVISVNHVSKSYHLGQIGTGTFSNDLKTWWAKKRGLPNPLLKIGGKDYGNRDNEEVWALRDISFSLTQGEVLGIIGTNGAGKSTLLKILSRITSPTSGKIKIKGSVSSLLEVGTGFHPELTGRENVFLNGTILGMTHAEITAKFEEIVSFAEVERYIDTPVKRYSSGMYVRLAFAVAAHLNPDILVVDEVLAVGDAGFQAKCLGKMEDSAQQGRTILFVSHNMAAIKQLCPRTILISKGIIETDGESENAIEIYLKNTKPEEKGRRTKKLHEFGLVLIKMTIHDESGNEKSIFSRDEKLIIRFHLQNTQEPRDIGLFASVEDFNTARLFASYSGEEGILFSAPTGTSTFDFVINHLPLNDGTFSVSGTIHNAKPDVHVDGLYQASYFEVCSTNDPKPDSYFNTNNGPIHVAHHWKISA